MTTMPFEPCDKAVREYAVSEYMSGQRTQKSFCAELGIGQSTLSKWIKNEYKKNAVPKENKAGFVQELGEVLQGYAKRKYKYIDYIVNSDGTESVKIVFHDEADREYNVTGESCIGIMGIIAHALR